MSVFKCKMCGGSIEFENGASVGICDSCGTRQTLPKTADETVANLFNRANNLRLKCEFDKAAQIYEKIVQTDDSEAEAHWGLVLCKYGIEYVEDPKDGRRVPTCHRTCYDAVTADADYCAALDYSDSLQQSIYESEARAVDRIQKDILAVVKNEKPFDVFICYKETDEKGKRTQDSVIANDIYYQLTQEGFKVFYAAITLEDKLGQEYEPYIFAALQSAKVMLAVGTKPEYFNAVWVKNEWGRYLNFMKTDRKKLLIPCYRDMDAYELPGEFAHLQAQDMSRIGFINDIVRGIKKVIGAEAVAPAAKETVRETVLVNEGANAAPLLKRMFMFLEDGDWAKADDFCEQVLNQDPENAQAYLGKLMAELRVRKKEDLKNCVKPFDGSNNYQKAVRFGDTDLPEYVRYINERCENARRVGIYESAEGIMRNAKSEKEYKEAAGKFESISGFKDADSRAKACREEAEACRMERERKAEETRLAAEKAAQMAKKIAVIGMPIVAACVAFAILLNTVIIPNRKYNAAVALMDAGDYDAAIAAFEAMDGYRDSKVQIENCHYNTAVALMDAGDYNAAIAAFEAMDGYRDSAEQIENCHTALKDMDYNAAVALMDAGDYDAAIAAFEAMDGYRDSETQIKDCQYANAAALMDAEKYREAATAFDALNGHRDSAARMQSCIYMIAGALIDEGKYDEAVALFETAGGYKDSNGKVLDSQTALKDIKYNAAVALMDSGKYAKAAAELKALDGYKDSKDKITECQNLQAEADYKSAVALMDAGKYSDAMTAFTSLNGYKDSKDKATECRNLLAEADYKSAVALMDAGKYSDAISAFEVLDGYKDSEDRISACQTALKDIDYNAAISLLNDGKIIDAYESLVALNGYKDSAVKASEIYDQYKEEKLEIGDIVYFGAYEQDNNISNGKEDIAWLVLAIESNKMLVISEYAFDYQPYNTEYKGVTWETCSLRTWLNSTFLNDAFSTEEQKRILRTTVTADKNSEYDTDAGNATSDKVFLLSIPEVEKYFTSEEARKCVQTAYAKAHGAYTDSAYTKGGVATCWWWLRSPGYYQNYAAGVYFDGSVSYSGGIVNNVRDAVRPALWINLDS